MSETYLTDPSIKLATILDTHYKKIGKQLGFSVNPPENLVNYAGYTALGQKQLDKAGDLFKLNVANYPQSANVFDSLGDYYVEVGDKVKAIENFKKSLSLKEIPDTRKKLEMLSK